MFWRKSSALLLGSLLAPVALAQGPVREGPAQIPAPTPVAPSSELPTIFHEEPARTTYFDRISLTGDYLWWWMKRAPSPAPYITTTRELGEGIPEEFTGALGDPNTQSLVDDDQLNFGTFSGLRMRASVTGPLMGLEIGGFLLERRSAGDFIAADLPTNNAGTDGGFPFLGRTFFDVVANRENAYFVSVPTFTTGTTRVSDQVEFFGAEANTTMRINAWNCSEITGFVGFRYLGLNEKLYFNDRITSLADLPPEVAIFYLGQPVFRDGVVTINDTFKTSNRFYAGQLGSVYKTALTDLLTFSIRGTVAVGVNQQLVQIDGFTQLRPDPTDANQNIRRTAGGIYAQPTNIGRYFNSEFSWSSEAEFNFEYQITPSWTARVGYSVLHWRNVVRPGDLIDRRLDRRAVPSDPTYDPAIAAAATIPTFAFKQSDIWVQGLTFGLELHY
jgi:hypothetical protein